MTCPTVTEMKRTRASNLNASRRYSGRKQKRQNRSSGPSSSDYNLLEPRLLLVNYHFGDAPEPYPVTLADHPDVARHGTGTDSYGSTSDGEHTDYADSSGVPFVATSIVSPGGTAFVADAYASVHTWKFDWDPNETYYVDGWVDWNQDGDWLDSGEQVLKRVPYNPFYYFRGFGDGHFPVPEDAALGGTFGRFRISSTGNLGPHTGLAADGLMDDVFFHVVQPDFQNPDSNGFAGLGDLKWVDADMGGSNSPVPIPKLADFNQDGATDIADWSGFTPYPTGAWIEGAFSQAFSGALSEYNRVGDINGDGMPDLVETEWLDGTYNGTPLNGQGAAVSSLNGSAVVGWANYISPRIVGYRFGVVDYDGDGRDDLVAETKNSEGISDGIYWLGGQSDFSLTLPTQADSVFQAAPYAQADIDGDGDVDLISHEAVYLRSNGTNFNRIALASAIDNYKGSEVLTTDLDQDGRREIIGVTGGWSNSNLTIQEFTGSGFTTVYTRPTRSRSSIIVTDLDNDSHNEIIVDGTGNHQISVLQFDGNFVANVQTYNHTDTDLGLRVVGSGDVGRNWATEYPSGTDFIAIPIETISPTEHAFTIMGALFYEVTPAPENNPPTVDPISDRTIQENVSWQTVTLTGITDGDADYNQPLRVTASSSNPGLIPNSENYLSVDYDSPDTTGDLRFKPVADETGSVVITVTVEDGGLDNNLETSGDNLTFSRSFTVTVNAGNNPPTLDSIADRTIDEDAAEQTVTLTGITDGDAEYNQPLRVTATSNNLGLISNPTVVYQSPNSTGSLKFTPVPDQYGSALITVTVEDGGDDNDLDTSGDNLSFSQTFTVTVNPVNDAPLLDPITDRSVQKNASQQTVGLTGIRAGGGESQPLRVTASSNNTNLIPTPEVDYTSANSTGNLRFTPAANQTGSAVITVTVEDGGLDGLLNTSHDNMTFSRSFTVTVDGVNFFTNGSQLLLELNNANQQITATSHGSSYTLTMSGGQWFGTDNSYVSGSGTNQLTVTNAGRSQFNEIRVDDNAVGGSFTFGDSGNNAYTEQFMILLDRMDAGNVSFTGDTRFTGNAGLTATTTLSISLSESGTRLETFDGDIVFSANRQATPRSFETDGVTLFESTIIATGLGNITLSGRGGYSEVNGNCGIDLLHGSATTSIVTNDGNLTIDGIGGGAGQSQNNFGLHVGSFGKVGSTGSGQVTIHGTGGVGSGSGQTGVIVHGLNGDAEIATFNGPLRVTGQGSSTGANRGVAIYAGGKIASTGQGDVIVDGTAGSKDGNYNFGVEVNGVSDQGQVSQIVSSIAALSVTGRGGGGGDGTGNHGVIASTGGMIRGAADASLTVTGTAGQSTGGWNKGVILWEPDETVTRARIDSLGGPVTIIGTGGSAGGPWNVGVHAYGSISAGGTGTVTVEGTGGQTDGGSNLGVWLHGTGEITSSGGDIRVTGTGAGEGAAGSNFGVWAVEEGQIAGVGSGDVTVTGYGGGGSGGNQIGVGLNGNNGYGRITAVDGNLTVIGYGGGDSNASSSEGVELWKGGEISTSGHGTISIEGTGSSASGTYNHGVLLYSVSDTGQPSQVVSNSGAVTITGQGNTNSSDTYQNGIHVSAGSVLSSGGDLTLLGWTNSKTGHGFVLTGNTSRAEAAAPGGILIDATIKLTNTALDFSAPVLAWGGGVWIAEIEGTEAETEYDQLDIEGTLELGPIDLAGSYVPQAGDVFTLIDNDGNDPISGRWYYDNRWIDEGDAVPFNGVELSVSYMGGDGNDFVLTTIEPGNNPPGIDSLDDITIEEDADEQLVALSGIDDGDGGNQPLSVTASSNNTSLIPNPTVNYSSPNTTGSIQFTPLADQHGTAVITVTVEDGGDDNDLNTSGDNLTTSRTFTVTVNPVNDTPLLDPIADRTHDKNSDEQTVNLTGIDAGGGESQPLHVTSSSNNTSLIPTPTVDYDTPNSTGSLRYTPVADQIGTAIITVRVEDGGLDGDLNTTGDNATVSRTFVVSVVEPTNLDFGDSPSPYPVTLSEDGARHEATGPTLGQSRDSEADGTHSVLADADGADEDGILFGLLHPGQLNSTVIVNVQNAPDGAVLDGWIDFNADKNWGGIDERVFANQVVAEGDNILKFDVPSATPSKSLVARFRLSTSGIDTVTGYANDGEVEDFLVTVSPPVKSTLEFSSPTSLLSSGTRITRSVDIDGDGDIDFFGSLSSGNGYWAEQTEAGTFVSHPLDYEIVDAVDIDFDNDIDFLAISDTKNDLLLLKNQGDQTLIVESLGVNLTGASYGSFDGNGEGRVADVDGDGDLDIAITVSPDSGTDQLHLIEQTSTGWTSHIASTNGGGALYDSHFADLDNDGDLDISYATYDGPSVGRVGWYRNDGNWSFTELNWTTDWGQATGAFPVDFDEDGNMDVLATGPSDLDEEIELFQNNGDATFTQIIPQSEITPHTFGANSVFPADLSGDGNFDIVWGDWWGRTVGWIPHSTSSPYSVVKLHTFGTAGNFVWADDVNNDGAMDILVANYHSSGSNGSVFLISNTGYVTLDAVHDVVMRTASIDVGLTGISSNRDGGSTLRITASSSNPALVDATVDYTSPNSKGNLHLVRKSVVEGVVLITVMVEDAGADGNLATTEDNVTFRRDFAVSVQSQSFPPTLDPISDRTLQEDTDEQSVSLSGITDGDTGNQLLRVTASSNNTSLIPTPTVDYNSPDSTGTVRFTPLPDQFGTANITVTVEDGGNDNDLSTTDDNLSFSRSFTVTVNPVNDRPVLDETASPSLGDIVQDSPVPTGPVGTLVSDLIDEGGKLDNFSDVDGDLPGLAIIDLNLQGGTLWQTGDNGAQWTRVESASDQDPLLLLADSKTRVYYQPAAGFSGSIEDILTIRAWDRNPAGPISELGDGIDGVASGDQSGIGVALSQDGLTMAVGARYHDSEKNDAGQVRIYRWSGNEWIQLGSDIYGEGANDQLGEALSFSADGLRLAIGAHRNDDQGSDAGHARVYEWDGTEWIQLGQDLDGQAANDWYGVDVDLSHNGMTLAVGARDGGDSSGGYTDVYRWNGESWQPMGQRLMGQSSGGRFGQSVSISETGTTIAIGAEFSNANGSQSGEARIYNWDGQQWQQMGATLVGESPGDKFGHKVSISGNGDVVAVGAHYDDAAGPDAGHTRVFEWSGVEWIQRGNDIDGEAAGDKSGYNVSLSDDGNRVAISARFNDGNGQDSGHARIFQWDGLAWVQMGDDIDGEGPGEQIWRLELSGDGSKVVIGAYNNDRAGNNAGVTRVYSISSIPFESTLSTNTDTVAIDVFSIDPLGPVDSFRDEGVTVDGERWYQGSTSQTGRLTMLAQFDADSSNGDLEIELLDAQKQLIATATPVASGLRIDYTADVGETFYLKLIGNQTDIDLRILNLLKAVGDTVTVAGTDSADDYSLTTGANHRLVVNGIDYTFSGDDYDAFNIDGAAGADSIWIGGTSDAESIELRMADTQITGAGYTVQALNIGDVVFAGRGGADTANFYDTNTADTFISSPSWAKMVGSSYSHIVRGLPTVTAHATVGYDLAYMNDSAGDDTYETFSERVVMTSDTHVVTAIGFKRSSGTSSGGNDTATAHDSAGNDRLLSYEDRIILFDGTHTHTSIDFGTNQVFASGQAGDVAYMFDSAGDDQMVARPESTVITRSDRETTAQGFAQSFAYASTGNDTAEFYDTSGNNDYNGYLDRAVMKGDGIFLWGRGFDQMTGHFSSGTDRALMFDSEGDDTYVSGASDTTMSNELASNRVVGYTSIYAYSNGGTDTATLHDTAGQETFRAYPDKAVLHGDDMFSWTRGFSQVTAHSSGGTDESQFYDSAGDDTFRSEGATSQMSGDGYLNLAQGFLKNSGYSSGGSDTALMYDTSGDDLYRTYPTESVMIGSGVTNAAYDFENTQGFSNTGTDSARLFDSAGDDLLMSYADRATLSGDGWANEVVGFYLNTVYGSGGYDQATMEDSTGDDLVKVRANGPRLTQGDGTVFDVRTFDRILARSVNGGEDIAELLDVDYEFELEGDWNS